MSATTWCVRPHRPHRRTGQSPSDHRAHNTVSGVLIIVQDISEDQ